LSQSEANKVKDYMERDTDKSMMQILKENYH